MSDQPKITQKSILGFRAALIPWTQRWLENEFLIHIATITYNHIYGYNGLKLFKGIAYLQEIIQRIKYK